MKPSDELNTYLKNFPSVLDKMVLHVRVILIDMSLNHWQNFVGNPKLVKTIHDLTELVHRLYSDESIFVLKKLKDEREHDLIGLILFDCSSYALEVTNRGMPHRRMKVISEGYYNR